MVREGDTPDNTDEFENLRQTVEAARELALELLSRDGEPCPSRSPEHHQEALPLELEGRGLSLEEVTEDLRRLLTATPRTAGPLFFNQLFGGRDPAAVLVEMLSPLVNSSMYTYKVAGPQILIEREVIGQMLSKVGFESGEGMFTPGGSLSNFTAMLLARNNAIGDAREHGLDDRRLTIYTSQDSHYSITKNAGMLGIGRRNVRKVDVDAEGRMKVSALRHMITEDLAAGAVPVCIVATAGTTVLGAFDPIEAMAEVAEENGIWFHVDGALGATLLLSSEHRHLLSGSDRADSVAWNPHKMMGVPLTCSVVLLRQEGRLAESLDETAEYLFQGAGDALNPGRRSIQCGRRNNALKLWAAWRLHGEEGWERRIARQFELADHAVSIIETEPRLRLVRPPQSINVCFEIDGASAPPVCTWLERERGIRIGHAPVDGTPVIRLVCVNPDLRKSDLDALFSAILEAADAVGG